MHIQLVANKSQNSLFAICCNQKLWLWIRQRLESQIFELLDTGINSKLKVLVNDGKVTGNYVNRFRNCKQLCFKFMLLTSSTYSFQLKLRVTTFAFCTGTVQE